jgi:hypothetical protein
MSKKAGNHPEILEHMFIHDFSLVDDFGDAFPSFKVVVA